MTMLIEITNRDTDTSRVLVVTHREHGNPTSAPSVEISAGSSMTFYVWSTHDLVISEKQLEKSDEASQEVNP